MKSAITFAFRSVIALAFGVVLGTVAVVVSPAEHMIPAAILGFGFGVLGAFLRK